MCVWMVELIVDSVEGASVRVLLADGMVLILSYLSPKIDVRLCF